MNPLAKVQTLSPSEAEEEATELPVRASDEAHKPRQDQGNHRIEKIVARTSRQ